MRPRPSRRLRPGPFLTSLTWMTVNALRRWPLAGAATLAGLGAVSLAGRLAAVRHGLLALAHEPVWVPLLAVMTFTPALLRRRRHLRVHAHRHWLAALPGAPSVAARVAVALLPALAALLLGTVLVLPLTSGLPWRVPLTLALGTLAGYSAAFGLAAVIGRLVPPERGRLPDPAASRRGGRQRRGLENLGDWPLAQARFWGQPRIQARSLLPLLLGLPLEVSGAVALAAAGVWLALLYLLQLLTAVVRVAFAAAWWLAPTPAGTLRFIAALCGRALLRQGLLCALLVTPAWALAPGQTAHAVFTGALLWMTAAAGISVLACLLARRRHPAASVLHRWLR